MIVGVMEEKHVGGQLRKAAEKLGVEARFMDTTVAYRGTLSFERLRGILDDTRSRLISFPPKFWQQPKR